VRCSKRRRGIPGDHHEATARHLEAVAAAEGLTPYIVADSRMGSTSLTHQLLAHASDLGLEDTAWRHLYRSYFGEGRDVFTLDALVGIAAEIGLDAEEARRVLTDRRHAQRVADDAADAQALGATGVPFIVIDRRYGIAGAQPLEVFSRTLEVAWQARRGELVTVDGDGSACCGPGGCAGS